MTSSADYEITVIIPIYNRAAELPEMIRTLDEWRRSSSTDVCVLFVDDGSTDGSLSVICQACLRLSSFYYISLVRHSGPSGALKAGLAYTGSPWCVMTLAGPCFNPQHIDLLTAGRQEAALVCGMAGQSPMNSRRGLPAPLNCLRRLVTDSRTDAARCVLMLGRTSVLAGIPWFSGMHMFVPDLVRLQGQGVKAVKVTDAVVPVTLIGQDSRLRRWICAVCDVLVFLWMRRRYTDPAVRQGNIRRPG